MAVSILIVITILIFSNYPRFRENISLKKTAQEVALTIRQAQTYGLSVREFQPGSNIYPGYGVHFALSSSDSFILFADLNGNSAYDGSGEEVEAFKIQTSERISSLCAHEKNPPSAGCSFNSMDIIFFRPNPLITLKANGVLYSDVEIKLISPREQIKTVVVLSTGQISVE